MAISAMILAAGRGSRMQELTSNCPKPLLKLGSKEIIVHLLERLRCAGISNIVINLHYLGERIVARLENGRKFGVNISYSYEPSILETGGGIVQALALLPEQQFMVISGDVYTDYPFSKLAARKLNGPAHLVLVHRPTLFPSADFGLCDGNISLSHKAYTYANIGLFHPSFFNNAPQSAFKFGDWLRSQAVRHTISGEIFSGVWHNLSTKQQLQELDKQLISRE